MAHDRCLACGTELSGASRCPNCARPKPMLLLDLQASAVSSGPRPQDGRARAAQASRVDGARRHVRPGGGDRRCRPVRRQRWRPRIDARDIDARDLDARAIGTDHVAPTTTRRSAATASSSTARPATTASTRVGRRTSTVAWAWSSARRSRFRLYAFDATMLRGYVDTGTGQLINAASSVPARPSVRRVRDTTVRVQLADPHACRRSIATCARAPHDRSRRCQLGVPLHQRQALGRRRPTRLEQRVPTCWSSRVDGSEVVGVDDPGAVHRAGFARRLDRHGRGGSDLPARSQDGAGDAVRGGRPHGDQRQPARLVGL